MNPSPSPLPGPVRPPRQAGRFYEADPARLRATVTGLLAGAAPAALEGKAIALVAPHAGYVYSGHVAAAAYRQLEGRAVDGVLLLAPSHYVDFNGAALPAAAAFATPLGEVALDLAAVEELKGHAGFSVTNGPHDAEHAIEVQLPFLQLALKRPAALLPLALGRPPRAETLEPLAGPLLQLLEQRGAAGEDWLILASTDTYHGHDPEACAANDIELERMIETLNTAALLEATRRRKVMACGWVGLALAMELARRLGARRGQILKRSDSRGGSGPVGDYVVGYLAAAFV